MAGADEAQRLQDAADDEQPAEHDDDGDRGDHRIDDGQEAGRDQQDSLDEIPKRILLDRLAHRLAEDFRGGIQRHRHGSSPCPVSYPT
jgi:hypothetical protein